MILHSYLTDGFITWTLHMLETFKYYNGDNLKFILTTRDLNENQIEQLKSVYKNLIIENKTFDYNEISKRMKLDIESVKKHKHECETYKGHSKSTIWKQFVSVEERYRDSIIDIMKRYENEKYILHLDADLSIRNNCKPLFKFVKNHDISIRYRTNPQVRDRRKFFGAMIGFKICDNVYEFMNEWINRINKLPLYEKPKWYGQTTFYNTYMECKDIDINWGFFPKKFIAAHKRNDQLIWSGNSKNGKISDLIECKNDFDERIK